MSKKSLIKVMLELQAKMNDVAKPDWLQNPPPYLRAALVEGVEAIDHWGFKWWKKQTPDHAETVMELIDIAHFYWSELIVNFDGSIDAAAAVVDEAYAKHCKGGIQEVVLDGTIFNLGEIDLVRKLEVLAGLSVVRRLSLELFFSILDDLNVSFDDLYKIYIGKNQMNHFRQTHGYKEGTYVKIWNGEEDNVHLNAILAEIDVIDETLFDKVGAALASRYPG